MEKKLISGVCCSAAHRGDHFVIKYLGEIEPDFENILACLSGAQMGLNHEKTGGRKSCDTLPFKGIVSRDCGGL